VINTAACQGDCGQKCKEACKYDAIDLDMKADTIKLKVGHVVAATGWDLYDTSKVDTLGAGSAKNAVTNMQMERLAAPSGPTAGRIQRPSDGKEPKKVIVIKSRLVNIVV